MKHRKHDHGACSNTRESFETFIGCKVVGVLTDIDNGRFTLVFACGWGLTANSNGAFWTTGPEEIKGAKEDLRQALALAGAK